MDRNSPSPSDGRAFVHWQEGLPGIIGILTMANKESMENAIAAMNGK
ncbi:hypothetical protein Tco_0117423, partial [Tanacetum coccineum]